MNLTVRFICIFLFMLMLSILPMPLMISSFRPPWVLLLSLYVQLYKPDYFRLSWLLFIGLCLDVLLVTTMGEHALALLIVCWLATKKARRFEFYSLLQQIMFIGSMCLVYEWIISLMDRFLGYQTFFLPCFASALMGLLFWPWIKLIAKPSSTFQGVKYEL